MPEESIHFCETCGEKSVLAKGKRDRLPRGWKKIAGRLRCEKCAKSGFKLRAVTLRVSGPVDREWSEFNATLKEQWGAFTGLCNWLYSELYVRDEKRAPGMEKMPKHAAPYLYPEARQRFPGIPSTAVAATEQACRGKYKGLRYNIIWLADAVVPTAKYPQPIHVPTTAWSLEVPDDSPPIVHVKLDSGPRWSLRLAGGAGFAHQREQLKAIADGKAERGPLELYRKRGSTGDHRRQDSDRDNGGQKCPYNVMCKIVAWLPKSPQRLSGRFVVRTDREAFLIGLNDKDKLLWTYHGLQVRKWTKERDKRKEQFSDDRKFEERPMASFQSQSDAQVSLFHRRIDSFMHETSSYVANYAVRRRLGEVRLDLTDRGFVDHFPWHRFAELVKQKCTAHSVHVTL